MPLSYDLLEPAARCMIPPPLEDEAADAVPSWLVLIVAVVAALDEAARARAFVTLASRLLSRQA